MCLCNFDILEYNLHSKSTTKFTDTSFPELFTEIICINGVIHVFDGGCKHFIFHKENSAFDEICQLSYEQFIGKAVYLKSKKTIVLFDANTSFIYEYQTWNKTWITHAFEPMNNMGHVQAGTCATTNEKYILIFGGFIPRKKDSIFLFDVHNKTFTESSIKCPFREMCRATIMRNDHEDEVIVYGFVNQCFAAKQFIGVGKLPIDVIKLINRLICNEWVHLISFDQPPNNHWKIHIDSLFS